MINLYEYQQKYYFQFANAVKYRREEYISASNMYMRRLSDIKIIISQRHAFQIDRVILKIMNKSKYKVDSKFLAYCYQH